MTFTIVENVRGFFISRPPLVLFMICLASFAIALITFAYIVKVRDMPNPDITEDWNTFLENLSDLDYCVVSEPGAAISNTSQVVAVQEAGLKEQLGKLSDKFIAGDSSDQGEVESGVSTTPVTTTTTTASSTNLVNVSVVMQLELIATGNLQRITTRHNYTYIAATLSGSQLGLKGSRKDLEANLTVVLPPLVNQSHQCQHGQCYKLSACVTMVAPQHFFPDTPHPDGGSKCVKDLNLDGENHFHFELAPNYLHCTNNSILTLRHEYDPSLTVMLTLQDRSIINLHLMHTSYFLFVMIVTLLCYAIVKGRPGKVKVAYTQCATEANSPNQS